MRGGAGSVGRSPGREHVQWTPGSGVAATPEGSTHAPEMSTLGPLVPQHLRHVTAPLMGTSPTSPLPTLAVTARNDAPTAAAMGDWAAQGWSDRAAARPRRR